MTQVPGNPRLIQSWDGIKMCNLGSDSRRNFQRCPMGLPATYTLQALALTPTGGREVPNQWPGLMGLMFKSAPLLSPSHVLLIVSCTAAQPKFMTFGHFCANKKVHLRSIPPWSCWKTSLREEAGVGGLVVPDSLPMNSTSSRDMSLPLSADLCAPTPHSLGSPRPRPPSLDEFARNRWRGGE